MGDDYCKDKGVEVMGDGAGVYFGLAAGIVQFVRGQKGDVVDKPEVGFEGHAHVVNPHPHAPQAALGDEEAVPAETLDELDRYYAALLNHFTYHVDPAPESAGWSGPPLERSA